MHLASDIDDLLTRPSASTEPAEAALQSVKSERGRSLAPNPAHSLTNTDIYMINTSTTVDLFFALRLIKTQQKMLFLQFALLYSKSAEDKETSLSASNVP